jgi:hypothetical protein
MKCSEMTMICECPESHHKSDKSTDRSTKKWFPGMLPKALQTLAKMVQPFKSLYRGDIAWHTLLIHVQVL